MKHLIEFKLFETFSKDEIIQKASKYKSLLDLRKDNSNLYRLVISNSLEKVVFPRTSKWTKEKIREVANNHKTRSEFAKKAQGAYVVAKGLNMLDELFSIKKSD
jgi:tRNA U34 2-thiouridine synthase MnmA/TrmU